MDFGFFTVSHFLLELEILFLEQDFGHEQDFRPKILLETEILLEEQDFELEQEMKNGEKTEIHFLLDRNPVCVRSGLNERDFTLENYAKKSDK